MLLIIYLFYLQPEISHSLALSARIPSILHIEYFPTTYMEADINKSKFCYHNIVIFVIITKITTIVR